MTRLLFTLVLAISAAPASGADARSDDLAALTTRAEKALKVPAQLTGLAEDWEKYKKRYGRGRLEDDETFVERSIYSVLSPDQYRELLAARRDPLFPALLRDAGLLWSDEAIWDMDSVPPSRGAIVDAADDEKFADVNKLKRLLLAFQRARPVPASPPSRYEWETPKQGTKREVLAALTRGSSLTGQALSSGDLATSRRNLDAMFDLVGRLPPLEKWPSGRSRNGYRRLRADLDALKRRLEEAAAHARPPQPAAARPAVANRPASAPPPVSDDASPPQKYRERGLSLLVARAKTLLRAVGTSETLFLLHRLPGDDAYLRERWLLDVRATVETEPLAVELAGLAANSGTAAGKAALDRFTSRRSDFVRAYAEFGESVAAYRVYMRTAMYSAPQGTMVDPSVLGVAPFMLPDLPPGAPLRAATRTYAGRRLPGLEYRDRRGLRRFFTSVPLDGGGVLPANLVFDAAGNLERRHLFLPPAGGSGSPRIVTERGRFDERGRLTRGLAYAALSPNGIDREEVVVEPVENGRTTRSRRLFEPGAKGPKRILRETLEPDGRVSIRHSYEFSGKQGTYSSRETHYNATGAPVMLRMRSFEKGERAAEEKWTLTDGVWRPRFEAGNVVQGFVAGETALAPITPGHPERGLRPQMTGASLFAVTMPDSENIGSYRLDLSALAALPGPQRRVKLTEFVVGPLLERCRRERPTRTAGGGFYEFDHIAANPGAYVAMLDDALEQSRGGAPPVVVIDMETRAVAGSVRGLWRIVLAGPPPRRYAARWGMVEDREEKLGAKSGLNVFSVHTRPSQRGTRERLNPLATITSLNEKLLPLYRTRTQHGIFGNDTSGASALSGSTHEGRTDLAVLQRSGPTGSAWKEARRISGAWRTVYVKPSPGTIIWEAVPKAGESIVAVAGSALASIGFAGAATLDYAFGDGSANSYFYAMKSDLADRTVANMTLNPLVARYRSQDAVLIDRAKNSKYYIMEAPEVMARQAVASKSFAGKVFWSGLAATTNFGLQNAVGLATFGPLGSLGGARFAAAAGRELTLLPKLMNGALTGYGYAFHYGMLGLGAHGAFESTFGRGGVIDSWSALAKESTPENELRFYRSLNNWSAATMPFVMGALGSRKSVAKAPAAPEPPAGSWFSRDIMRLEGRGTRLAPEPPAPPVAEAPVPTPPKTLSHAEAPRALVERLGPPGKKAAAAYEAAARGLAELGLKAEGVAGSYASGTPRTRAWPKEIAPGEPLTFRDALILDKMPTNPELSGRYTGRMKQLYDLKLQLLKEGRLPSDLDLITRGDSTTAVAEALRARIFEETGVLIEYVEPFTAERAGSAPASRGPPPLLQAKGPADASFLVQPDYGYSKSDTSFTAPMGRAIEGARARLAEAAGSDRPVTPRKLRALMDEIALVRRKIAETKGDKDAQNFGRAIPESGNGLARQTVIDNIGADPNGVFGRHAGQFSKAKTSWDSMLASEGNTPSLNVDGVVYKLSWARPNGENFLLEHPSYADMIPMRAKAFDILAKAINDPAITESAFMDSLAQSYQLMVHATPYVRGSPAIIESFFDAALRQKFGKTLPPKTGEPFWDTIWHDPATPYTGAEFLKNFGGKRTGPSWSEPASSPAVAAARENVGVIADAIRAHQANPAQAVGIIGSRITPLQSANDCALRSLANDPQMPPAVRGRSPGEILAFAQKVTGDPTLGRRGLSDVQFAQVLDSLGYRVQETRAYFKDAADLAARIRDSGSLLAKYDLAGPMGHRVSLAGAIFKNGTWQFLVVDSNMPAIQRMTFEQLAAKPLVTMSVVPKPVAEASGLRSPSPAEVHARAEAAFARMRTEPLPAGEAPASGPRTGARTLPRRRVAHPDESVTVGMPGRVPPTDGYLSRPYDGAGQITGHKANIHDRLSPINRRSLTRQNESADVLERHGYRVEMFDENQPRRDYIIRDRNGYAMPFDCYAPYFKEGLTRAEGLANIRAGAADKVAKGETRLIVNLTDTPFTAADVGLLLRGRPIEGLSEILFIEKDGSLHQFDPRNARNSRRPPVRMSAYSAAQPR